MQFTPNGTWTEDSHKIIENIPSNVILTKTIGRQGISLPSHSHSLHQIIYTLSGTLRIEADGRNHFAPERHIVWIPKGVSHKLSSCNKQISLVASYYHLETDTGGEISVYRADEMIGHNINFISKREEIDSSSEPEIFTFAKGFFDSIPYICKESTFPTHDYTIIEDERLRKILDYIQYNRTKDLTIGSIASTFGYSVRSLTRMFANSNLKFVNYLNLQRVIMAIEILSEGTMNIEHTAYEVGFNSPNSFARVFRQITGESPSSFMKK